MEPKRGIFIPGREILDPGSFENFIYPSHLSTTTDSPLEYHPDNHPTPGLPANPRMYLARLYCQLGTYLDYYTGEHDPSLSQTLMRRRQAVLATLEEYIDGGQTTLTMPEDWGGPLIPAHHRSLFPQLSVTSEWPEVFLIHGAEDNHVHCHESEHMKELLEKVEVEVTLKVIEGKGHSFDYDPSAEEGCSGLFNEVGKFLRRVLSKTPC